MDLRITINQKSQSIKDKQMWQKKEMKKANIPSQNSYEIIPLSPDSSYEDDSLSDSSQQQFEILSSCYDTLKVKNQFIPYGQQMLYADQVYIVSNKGLFKKNVKIHYKLEEFDSLYFWMQFAKEILKSIEKLSLSYCFEIITKMPLSLQIYIFLFQKLSKNRFKKLISEDDIFCEIVKNIYFLTKSSEMSISAIFDLQKQMKISLKQGYQRVFYLIDHFSVFQIKIKKSLENILMIMILQIISDISFLKNIAYDNQNKMSNSSCSESDQNISKQIQQNVCVLNEDFLQKIIKITETLQCMPLCKQNFSEEVTGNITENEQNLIKKYICNKQLFTIIKHNFETLFFKQRKYLMKVLVVGVNLNIKAFLQIFFMDSHLASKMMVNNSNSSSNLLQELYHCNDLKSENGKMSMMQKHFEELFVSNMFGQDNVLWQETIFILEKILKENNKMKIENVQCLIIKIFNQIIETYLNTTQINLIDQYFQEIDVLFTKAEDNANSHSLHQNSHSLHQNSHSQKGGNLSINKEVMSMQHVLQMFLLQQVNSIVDSLYEQNEMQLKQMKIERIYETASRYYCADKIPLQFHSRVNWKLVIKIFHLYYTFISKEQFLQCVIDQHTLDSIFHLMAFTEFRRGAVEGVRKSFIRKLYQFVYQQELQQTQKDFCQRNAHLNRTQNMRENSRGHRTENSRGHRTENRREHSRENARKTVREAYLQKYQFLIERFY